MSHIITETVNSDDDYRSLSPSTNSDDNISNCDHNAHRSCSRNASCTKNSHRNDLTNFTRFNNISNNSKPVKGDIRPADSKPEHRQKYDGRRWRRVCCASTCSTYLNGRIYYDNWLCRKHYIATFETDQDNESANLTTQNISINRSRKKNVPTTIDRQLNTTTKYYKRGTVRINDDGTREKFDGVCWRSVCSSHNCKSFAFANGSCNRHYLENRNKTLDISSSLMNTQPKTLTSNFQTKKSTKTTKTKPKKGEIRCVRQQWNGTKWYSLCHYNTGACQRRSAGAKSAYLCEKHFEEFKNKNLNQLTISNHEPILLSPTIKRKKSINNEHRLSTNVTDEFSKSNSYDSIFSTKIRKPVEQCIQTDVTYPVDSVDLRQGCILIEDDNVNSYECDSPQLMVYIKKEEVDSDDEDCSATLRKLARDIYSMPFNCKLELTKVESF